MLQLIISSVTKLSRHVQELNSRLLRECVRLSREATLAHRLVEHEVCDTLVPFVARFAAASLLPWHRGCGITAYGACKPTTATFQRDGHSVHVPDTAVSDASATAAVRSLQCQGAD